MASRDARPASIRIWTPVGDEPGPDASPDSAEASPDHAAPELLAAGVEALLFSSGAPVPAQRLAAALDVEAGAVRRAIALLERRRSGAGSGLRVARIAGGYQLTTAPEFRGAIGRLLAPKREPRLSEAALETLSVIAYRQPITMPELNALRGVRSQGVVATLLKRRLIRTRGRKRVVGRPLLYGTTRAFLDRFGLGGLDDLPRLSELEDDDAAAQVIPALDAASGRGGTPESAEDG